MNTLQITILDISFSESDNTTSTLISYINEAQTSIKVMVYTFTSDSLRDALIDAHNRNVSVQVILDSGKADDLGSEYQALLNAGIDVRRYEHLDGYMHHKVMIIDGHIIVTGSYNWSKNAEDNNDENVIIINSTNISEPYLTEFNRIWNQTTSSLSSEGSIVINEVEADPEGNDIGHEWVELYNPLAYSVDISGWTISSTHGYNTLTITFESGTILNSGQYYIVNHSVQWIDNSGEKIVLKNTSGIIQDQTLTFSDNYNNGSTWQRYPNGKDANQDSDWAFRYSTKENNN